jgi:hypothetical protein
VGHVNGELRQALLGHDGADQAGIDQRMIVLDAAPTKSRLPLVQRLVEQRVDDAAQPLALRVVLRPPAPVLAQVEARAALRPTRVETSTSER